MKTRHLVVSAVLVAFGATSSAWAKEHRKASGECVSAVGELVDSVKLKSKCVAPNKWVKIARHQPKHAKKSTL